MSSCNFELSWDEHEKSFITSGPGLQLRVYYLKIISYISTKTYVVGTQKNRLNEMVLLKHMLWVLKRTVSMRRFFEHPKHKLNLMGKKIFTIYAQNFCCSWPMLKYISGLRDQSIQCKVSFKEAVQLLFASKSFQKAGCCFSIQQYLHCVQVRGHLILSKAFSD